MSSRSKSPIVNGLRLLFLSPKMLKKKSITLDEESIRAPLTAQGEQKMNHFIDTQEEAFENLHGEVNRGATRAAVLGFLDGLISNLCLILGVMSPTLQGEQSDSRVILAGIAGIFAGACSMAVGEWLSMTAENDYLEKEIATEREHLATHRKEENAELVGWFERQGLQHETALQVIRDLENSPSSTQRMLNFHARFHWGIDEVELGGSPVQAAVISFLTFASGALVPLLPWLIPCTVLHFFTKEQCLWTKLSVTLFLSITAMFVAGFFLALNTSLNACLGGLRHVACGIVAAGITFGIGYGVGVSLE